MFSYLVIFVGGGLGSILRYFVNNVIIRLLGTHYPWGTFFINITGCLFLGFILTLALHKVHIMDNNTRLFLTVGFAGGFTTFSTFGYESMNLLKHSSVFSGLFYPVSSVIIGILAVYAGVFLAQKI